MKKIIISILLVLCYVLAFSQNMPNYWVPTSGTNTYATNIGSLKTYSNAVAFVSFSSANTGASTININSMGAIPIRKWDGSSWVTLSSGDIKTGRDYRISYDTTNGWFRLEAIADAFQQGPSVNGVPSSGTGGIVPITAGQDGQILRLSSGTLGFGGIDLSDPDAINNSLPATNVSFSPSGGISNGNVQSALTEVDAEKTNLRWPDNEQTTSYTGVLTDINKVIQMNSASALNFTVPPNSSVAYPIGTYLIVRQKGSGTVTIVEGAGVTITEPAGGTMDTPGQGLSVTLHKTATDAWDLENGSAGGGGSVAWGDLTGTLSDQTDLQSALNLKSPLASPAFTGTPTVPTASANTNNTQAASTAYADLKVTDAIADAVTTVAPSQNAVFDALALKANASLITESKKRLGTVVDVTPNASSGSLYSDTSPQTTFTFTSGGITTTGGNSDALNFLTYTGYHTNVHYWSRKIRFTPTADGTGIGLGLESFNGKIIGRMIATGANKGKVLIDVYRTGTLTNKATSTAALSYTNSTDVIELTLTKSLTSYIITAQIVGTPSSVVSVEYIDDLLLANVSTVWAVSNPAIYHFGGDQTITLDRYTVNEYVGNDLAFFGDSIAAGAFATNGLLMWGTLMKNWMPTGVSFLAGGGNRSSDWANERGEFLSLKPRVALWCVGINDIINSVSAATTQANTLQFIQDCLANGITPVLCEILPNATYTSAITSMNSWMNGLGYVKVVPMYNAFNSSGSIAAIYDSGDGIHLNDYGNYQYAVTLVGVLKYLVPISQSYGPQVTTNGWTNGVSYNSGNIHIQQNSSSGAASYVSYRTKSNQGTGYFNTYSSNFATTGYASKSALINDQGGIMIMSSAASNAPIDIMVGGNVLATHSKVQFNNNGTTFLSPTTIVAGTTTNAPFIYQSGSLLTTIAAGRREYNGSHYVSSSSLNRMGMGGSIADFFTDASNTGTGETDLYSYTTKASTLTTNGDKVTFEYTINLSDITSTAQVKVLFGGTTIGDTGALTVSATGSVVVRGYVMRTGTTTARASINISSPTASTAVYTAETDITGLTLSSTNILKVTGTAGGAGGGTGDITAKVGAIYFWPAANN